MPPLALTDHQVATIAAEFERGATRGALASRYGVHPNTITRALRRSDTPKRPGRRRALDADQHLRLVAAYASGMPTQLIASAFGVSAQHVSRVAIASGVEPRRPHLPGRPRRLVTARGDSSLGDEYLRGASIRQLAVAHGVAHATVRRALAAAGIERRASHAVNPRSRSKRDRETLS